jgi:hypothetical protein
MSKRSDSASSSSGGYGGRVARQRVPAAGGGGGGGGADDDDTASRSTGAPVVVRGRSTRRGRQGVLPTGSGLAATPSASRH